MDNSISPVSVVTTQPYTPPAAKTAASAAASAVVPQDKPAAVPAPQSSGSGNSTVSANPQQYETALYQAAQSFKNTYAVSDQSFSIFKDATGKYITRYVSLRDGKVTYLPEPTLVKQLQTSGESATSTRVAISV